jgi:hypothetical protein
VSAKCRKRHKGVYSFVALELWNESNVSITNGEQHALAKSIIRVRLAKARKVLMVPLTWLEWMRLDSSIERETYLLAKLRSAGLKV